MIPVDFDHGFHGMTRMLKAPFRSGTASLASRNELRHSRPGVAGINNGLEFLRRCGVEHLIADDVEPVGVAFGSARSAINALCFAPPRLRVRPPISGICVI